MRYWKFLVAWTLLAGSCIGADFPTNSTYTNIDISTLKSDFRDFKFSWIGWNDQLVQFTWKNSGAALDITNFAATFKIEKGTNYYVLVETADIVKSTNSMRFFIAHTNIPPDGFYQAEAIIYIASDPPIVRTAARGSVDIQQSIYATDDSAFPYPELNIDRTTFIGLTDVPTNYSGQAGKAVVVNGSETGLEFTDTGAGDISSVAVSGGLLTGGGSSGAVTIALTTGTVQTALSGYFALDSDMTLVKGYTSQVANLNTYTSRVINLETYTNRVIGVEAYTSRVASLEPWTNNVLNLETYTNRTIALESYTGQVVNLNTYTNRVIDLEGYTGQVVNLNTYTNRVIDLESYTARVVAVEAYTNRIAIMETGKVGMVEYKVFTNAQHLLNTGYTGSISMLSTNSPTMVEYKVFTNAQHTLNTGYTANVAMLLTNFPTMISYKVFTNAQHILNTGYTASISMLTTNFPTMIEYKAYTNIQYLTNLTFVGTNNATYTATVAKASEAQGWGDHADAGYLTATQGIYPSLYVGDRSVLGSDLSTLTQGVYTGALSSIAYTGNAAVVYNRIYEWGFTKVNAFGTSVLTIASETMSATAAGARSNYFVCANAGTSLVLTLQGDGSSKSDVTNVYLKQILGGSLAVASNLYVGKDVLLGSTSSIQFADTTTLTAAKVQGYDRTVTDFPAISNAAITGSNLASQANGYAVAGSNLALVASNQAALAQGWAQAGSNLAYNISLGTGGWGQVVTDFPAVSNAAITGSNLASQANGYAVAGSNLALLASNLAAQANGYAVAGSNLAYAVSLGTATWARTSADIGAVSNAAITGSNLAAQANGYAVAGSNLALLASNQAALAQGWAQGGSNLAYAISLDTGAWARTTADFGVVSNAAMTGSNLALFASNQAALAQAWAQAGSNLALIASNRTVAISNALYAGYITNDVAFSNALYAQMIRGATIVATNTDAITTNAGMLQINWNTNAAGGGAGSGFPLTENGDLAGYGLTNGYFIGSFTGNGAGLTNVPGVETNTFVLAGGSNISIRNATGTNWLDLQVTTELTFPTGRIAMVVSTDTITTNLQIVGGSPTNGAVLLATNTLGQAKWGAVCSFNSYGGTVMTNYNATASNMFFATEITDYGNNFDGTTFTAPVHGIYIFTIYWMWQQLSGSATYMAIFDSAGSHGAHYIYANEAVGQRHTDVYHMELAAGASCYFYTTGVAATTNFLTAEREIWGTLIQELP